MSLGYSTLTGYTAGMVLEIVKFGHPVLRTKGKRIDRVTAELRQFANDLKETMYVADGVGLAAHQVNRAIMLSVVDVRASELPSELRINGQPQNLNDWMPLTLLNPTIQDSTGEVTGTEGCLSFPEISAKIRRAETVTVHAHNLAGQELNFVATGLLARALQHEFDHLNGGLFIDRMDAATRASLAGKLKKLQKETKAALLAARKPRRILARI
ncbi:MAG: peptide deformylase [Verrucomicrobiota bacterium]